MVKKVLSVILVTYFLISNLVFADVNDYWDCYWTNADNLTMQVYSSASIDFPLTMDTTYSWAWNGIDSNCNIDNLYLGNSYTGASIEVRGIILAGSTIGRCNMYYGSGGSIRAYNPDTMNVEITKAIVYLDTTAATDYGALLDNSPASQQRTYMHEIGHALCLAHPDVSESINAIMHQSTHANATNTIQTHDKYNLQQKY